MPGGDGQHTKDPALARAERELRDNQAYQVECLRALETETRTSEIRHYKVRYRTLKRKESELKEKVEKLRSLEEKV